MNGREDLASFAHGGVRISALVPATWSVSEVAENQVRFHAPTHPEHDEHSPTFSISRGEPAVFGMNGYGPDEFQDFCDASLANLEQGLAEFELRGTERFVLSSFVDVYAVWYSCRSDSGLAFAQLQALGLMDRYNLYLINAATLLSLADVYLPTFHDILRSLRMLPALSPAG